MIWATVSSRSRFCWLYRASPSLVAKNIINLISVLTIWWCPYVESSLVLLEKSVCYVWPMCSLGKTRLAFALLHSIFQGQICLLLQVFLEKAEEPEIKLPTSTGSWKKQEGSTKTSISALLTMPKPLTVWITINCGKLWKRWEYQTTWPASWET